MRPSNHPAKKLRTSALQAQSHRLACEAFLLGDRIPSNRHGCSGAKRAANSCKPARGSCPPTNRSPESQEAAPRQLALNRTPKSRLRAFPWQSRSEPHRAPRALTPTLPQWCRLLRLSASVLARKVAPRIRASERLGARTRCLRFAAGNSLSTRRLQWPERNRAALPLGGSISGPMSHFSERQDLSWDLSLDLTSARLSPRESCESCERAGTSSSGKR